MSKARILEAVQRLDLETTRSLLGAKPELLEVTDRRGFNLFHLACVNLLPKVGISEEATVQMAEYLLDRGMPIDAAEPKEGCTALFFAVRGRNRALARYLVEQGAKPANAPGGGLYAAGWWEDLDMLDLLIDNGADIEVVAGVTPFLACWCSRRFKAAKHLAIRGANVNVQDQKGKTALHHGIEKEFDPDLLLWLVQHGASPDIEDGSGVSPRLKASRKRDRRFLAALS